MDEMAKQWQEAWPKALRTWGRWTRLSPPLLATTPEMAAQASIDDHLALFKLSDHSIMVNLPNIRRKGLDQFPLQILAHEIGHHVLAPATLLDHFRLMAQVMKGLPTLENRACDIANIWTDLVVNDHLDRILSVPMDLPYRALKVSTGLIWNLYMRACERLWDLDEGTLSSREAIDSQDLDQYEADSWLISRTVRVYASDPIRGSGRFACLMLPWVVKEQEEELTRLRERLDSRLAGAGSQPPPGLIQTEIEDPIHPSVDPLIMGKSQALPIVPEETFEPLPWHGPNGQTLEPWIYNEILKLGGLEIDPLLATSHYYRERALPHLVHPPGTLKPTLPDPLPEGTQSWEATDPLEDLDVFQSIVTSPVLIPGITTVSRQWGEQPSAEKKYEPVDLDIYVDSSGSMPDPARTLSYPALAATIVALSTLRKGGCVQVTLWSGKHQCMRTDGFLRNEEEILKVICSHFGGATSFPIHALRESWKAKTLRPAHILHISDDGLSTLFDDHDEKGNLGWDIAQRALDNCQAGGTMALHLYPGHLSKPVERLKEARDKQGWALHEVSTQEELVEFACNFSKRHAMGRKQ